MGDFLTKIFFCVNRSRSWVAEEGEVFRKGTVLLGPAEMEGEYAGEELRKEVSKILTKLKKAKPDSSCSFWKPWLSAHLHVL